MYETGLIRDLVQRLEAAAHDAGAEEVIRLDVEQQPKRSARRPDRRYAPA